MERSNFITKLVSFLLFGALVAYLGFYLVSSLTDNVRTAPAVHVELADSVSVEGIIAREETLVSSGETYISVSADNGQLVAVGETIAVAYSGEAALERASRIHELELRQRYITTALSGKSADKDIKGREVAVKSAVTQLAAAAARGDMESISVYAVTLSSMVMESAGMNATQEELDAVNRELASLEDMSASDTKQITATFSGLFFASADGYEDISPEDILGITPEALRSLLGSAREDAPSDVIGKLVAPLEWYYAALVPNETAQRLAVGKSATLDFGRYCSSSLQGTVTGIKYQEDGDCAVVFRCTGGASEMLYARKVTAEIRFNAISGIRVPVNAVYEEQAEVENEETGQMEPVTNYFVYTVTGLQAEKKYIDIIWESAEYYLVATSNSSPDSLREGNDIIITNKNIYDGMMLE